MTCALGLKPPSCYFIHLIEKLESDKMAAPSVNGKDGCVSMRVCVCVCVSEGVLCLN